jgi:hypothetical protein
MSQDHIFDFVHRAGATDAQGSIRVSFGSAGDVWSWPPLESDPISGLRIGARYVVLADSVLGSATLGSATPSRRSLRAFRVVQGAGSESATVQGLDGRPILSVTPDVMEMLIPEEELPPYEPPVTHEGGLISIGGRESAVMKFRHAEAEARKAGPPRGVHLVLPEDDPGTRITEEEFLRLMAKWKREAAESN